MTARVCLPGLAACLLLAAGPAHAQLPSIQSPTPQASGVQDGLDARETRERLQQILRQLPPSVGDVLRRDPSLLDNATYLAPYPSLGAFLQQHPEIARNPSFYLGDFRYVEREPGDEAAEMIGIVLAGFGVAAGMVALLAVFVWLVRAIIEHRRWLRQSRVQAEVHTKLMDRLTSNEEILAYIQTPAGRRFLESAPLPVEGAPRMHGAPVTSILLSLQGGVVLVALGIGMWFLQGRAVEPVAEGFYIIGVIAASLGAGLVASALLAYVISSRLGLVATPRTDHA